MKQVININFQGRVVPIEVTAFEILNQYIDSLNRHFAAEPGKEEIINDIENRIGELFQERLDSGSNCITEEHVYGVIASMGRPEDFDSDAEKVEQVLHTYTDQRRRLYRDENNKKIGGVCSGIANYFDLDVTLVRVLFILFALAGFGILFYLILWIAVPGSSVAVIGGPRKRLYRDTDEKIIGGVCSGIGHYFAVNPWLPRTILLVLLFSTAFKWTFGGIFNPENVFIIGLSPTIILAYIIAWLSIPAAKTTAEKLEMKGEKVDFNSIKETVVAGMQSSRPRFDNSPETPQTPVQKNRSFIDILALLIKIVMYIILGFIGIIVLITLIAMVIASTQIFPYKGFIISDGFQNYMAWGSLIFFVIVPIVGFLVFIFRRLARIKRKSNVYRYAFLTMWVIGWFCSIALGISLQNDFKASSDIIENNIALENPDVQILNVSNQLKSPRHYKIRWNNISGLALLNSDSIMISNVHIQIAKSDNDSFKVSTIKMSEGPNRRVANRNATAIKFNVFQQDSTLVIDKDFPITKDEKFRNQMVVVTVYVPVGRKIKVEKNVSASSRRNSNLLIVTDNVERAWRKGTTYIMTEDGLYTTDGKKASRHNDIDDEEDYNDGPDLRDKKPGKRRIIIESEISKREKNKNIKADKTPDAIVIPKVKLAKEQEMPLKEVSWNDEFNLDAGYNHISMSAQ